MRFLACAILLTLIPCTLAHAERTEGQTVTNTLPAENVPPLLIPPAPPPPVEPVKINSVFGT